MINEIDFSVAILSLLLVFGGAFAIKLIAKATHVFQLRVAIVLMFLVVNVISGIIHLNRISRTDRGFYDMLSTVNRSDEFSLFTTIVCTGVGLFSLIVGVSSSQVKVWRNAYLIDLPDGWSRKLLILFSIIFTPISLYAIIVLNSYLDQDSMRRVISLSDGMARFAFMAHWFVWAVSFFAIWLATKSSFKTSRNKGFLLFLSVVAIFMSLRWTGGRTVGILMSLPLMIIFFGLMTRHRVKIIAIFLVSVVIYGIYLTGYRKENYASNEFSLVSALDWEFGKFSMTGFAVDYVHKHGYSFGETLYAGAFSIPYAILKLLGLDDGIWIPRMVTELTGKSILGNSSINYIVPGFSAEMYLNFGVLGVAVGYYILGRMARFMENSFVSKENIVEKFIFGYFGIILIFCTIPAQSGAFFGYIFFSGFPLLLILFFLKIRYFRIKPI